MSDGQTHTAINVLSLGATALLSVPLQLSTDLTIPFGAAFMAGTVLLSPDLDLAGKTRSASVKAWGLLAPLWWLYGRIFPHRGMSHAYLSGPLTRLLYLAVILSPLLLLEQVHPLLRLIEAVHLWSALLGYLISQWMHLALDRIPLRRLWS